MANPTPVRALPLPLPVPAFLRPWVNPYYLLIAGVLGAITTVFVVVIGLLVLVAYNFNILGLIE